MNDKHARYLLHQLLSRTKDGQLVLHEDGVARTFGSPSGPEPLRAHIKVNDPAFHRSILKGSLGLGQSYMDGLWDVDDMVTLIRIAARNVHRFDELRRTFRPVLAPVQNAVSFARRNTIERSREQIAAHYDLGNDLYELFLDDTMMYSSAVFDTPDTPLYDAQIAKLDRICQKLELKPGDRLLEIGTGWGALAVHAAGRYGAHVTTATISTEQHALATQRVQDAGLEDQITILLQDYRTLTGTYDKLVSVEMIEAVGWRDFPTFFRVCGERLAEDGVMLLQAITIDDRAYDVEKAVKSFINQLIFPGGCLPSVEIISRNMSRESDMRMVGLEDITGHYVTTLKHWRETFQAATAQLEERGYDDRFRRLWVLYLAYCEAGFAERRIQDVQVLLAKPKFRAEPFAALRPTGSPVRHQGGPRAVADPDGDAVAA
ncbi:MAG: class SAM-dependent methyltransferase [Solirubrobacterales bacterium]|nr:class SAM-dependent methyltransferase [Solirubrobacterales bacterium]